ncbi:MAG: hypothetical protein EOO02_13045, partial [Chitinophagaceae bacterium]
MLNPRTKDAVEILNGLIKINNDRIRFYKGFLDHGTALDAEYRDYFALVAGESYQNNIWISIEIQTIEGNIEQETPVNDVPGQPPLLQPLPAYTEIVAGCSKMEESIRNEYAKAMNSVFIPQYMR